MTRFESILIEVTLGDVDGFYFPHKYPTHAPMRTFLSLQIVNGIGYIHNIRQKSETLQVLLWHQVLPEVAVQKIWHGKLTLPVAGAGDYILIQSRIAAGHGSAWETWMKLGQPQNLSTEEMRLLRQHAQPESRLFTYTGAGESISLDLDVAPGEVLFLELRRQGTKALPKTGLRKQLAVWEEQMSATSKK